jgi:5-methylcytosine-specific restriction enzyme subunit McrC
MKTQTLQNRQKSFTFLLDMNLLFEQFIGKVLEEICTKNALRLHYQHKNSSILWNKSTGKPYRSVIPDFLIEKDRPAEGRSYTSAATGLPVDAKYKLYDNQKVSNADIYQTFLYAFAFNSERPGSSNQAHHAQALLLYPSGYNPQKPFTVAVRTGKGFTLGEIQVLGISVPELLAEIKSGKRSRPVSDSLLEQLNLILSIS